MTILYILKHVSKYNIFDSFSKQKLRPYTAKATTLCLAMAYD